MKRGISLTKDLETPNKPHKLLRSASAATPSEQYPDSFLQRCPYEIIFRIFSFLDVEDLSSMAFTGRAGRMAVELYLSSSFATQMLQFRHPHPPNAPNSFADVKRQLKYYDDIGTLFRRVYCFLTLPLRIQLVSSILQVYLCHHGSISHAICEKASFTTVTRPELSSPTLLIRDKCIVGRLRCPSTLFFGHFLRSFLSGCSPNEYQRFFHSLVHSCFGQNFWLRLTNLLCKRPNECPEEELTVRLFLRRVFLDPLSLPVGARPSWADFSMAPSPNGSPCTSNPSTSSGNSSSFSNYDCVSAGDPLSRQLSHRDVGSPLPFLRSSAANNLITSTPVVKSPNAQLASSSSPSTSSSSSPCTPWPAADTLAIILHSYPYVHQARLLFILYGPVHKGCLMWSIMCENTAADLKQLSACFGELGCVLGSMWLSDRWSINDTLAVFHEITNTPDGWLAENVACLLHSAGPQLSSLIVQNKARKGHVSELAVTLTSLCLVQVKIKVDLSGLLNLVGDAVQSTGNSHRQEFLDSLAHAFRGVIVDLYETDELDDRIEDFSIILKAQSYFFRALLARVYEE